METDGIYWCRQDGRWGMYWFVVKNEIKRELYLMETDGIYWCHQDGRWGMYWSCQHRSSTCVQYISLKIWITSDRFMTHFLYLKKGICSTCNLLVIFNQWLMSRIKALKKSHRRQSFKKKVVFKRVGPSKNFWLWNRLFCLFYLAVNVFMAWSLHENLVKSRK